MTSFEIGEFLLPVAERLPTDDATVFESVFHITQFALRALRNTTGLPLSEREILFNRWRNA